MNKIDPTATVYSTASVDPYAQVGNRARLELGVRIPGNAVVPQRGRAVA